MFPPDFATATAQFDRVAAACRELGRDPTELVRSGAFVVCVGRTDAEVRRRAEAIGQQAERLRATGLAGTPDEVTDRIGQWRERTGISRLYLQFLDLTDLDQIDLIADEVMPAVL